MSGVIVDAERYCRRRGLLLTLGVIVDAEGYC